MVTGEEIERKNRGESCRSASRGHSRHFPTCSEEDLGFGDGQRDRVTGRRRSLASTGYWRPTKI